jgi:rod shape-determining protein MreC
VVEKVIRDPERDSFIDVIVKPAAQIDRLDEVLVITQSLPTMSPEQQQDLATSEALKGGEATAIKDQKKASEIMAERLPGLTDPNAKPAAPPAAPGATPTQPGQDPTKPAVPTGPQAPKLLHSEHADRFSPGSASETLPQPKAAEPKSKTLQDLKPLQGPKYPPLKDKPATGAKPAQPGVKTSPPTTSRREP